MAVYDFFLSRNNGPSLNNYVGHAGRLFYDSNNGVIRLSDGVTPGGLSIPYTIATDTVVGGVKAGPGVTINSEGQILIDSAGLEFSFGDIQAQVGLYTDSTAYALMQTVNLNEDMVLASNGTGDIKVVGQFDVYKTNGTVTGSLENSEPVFTIRADGQMRMLVPGADSNEGALNIVGGLDGVFQNPVNEGVMLHITGIAGTPGVPSRLYNDAQNAFAAFVARRYNGTAVSPTAVLADEELMRISGTAHNGTIIPGTGNQRIVYRALGNQTLTNQGGSMELWATPINTTTLAKIATVDSTGITLESGKVLTGNVTGTADIATTVTLVATNSTDAAHYLTFVDSATGNENMRTDTGLTYNPSTNTLSASVAAFTTLTGKLIRNVRDAGVIADGGTLTINFATDAIVRCEWGNGLNIAYSNFTTGSVVKLLAYKTAGTGTDNIALGGLTAGYVSSGSLTLGGTAGVTNFVEFTCTGTAIGSVFAKV